MWIGSIFFTVIDIVFYTSTIKWPQHTSEQCNDQNPATTNDESCQQSWCSMKYEPDNSLFSDKIVNGKIAAHQSNLISILWISGYKRLIEYQDFGLKVTQTNEAQMIYY